MSMPPNDQQLIALSSLTLGQKAIIVGFSFDTNNGEQSQEIGFNPGEQLEIVRISPLGESIEIKIRGYFLSLHKQQADRIKVKPVTS